MTPVAAAAGGGGGGGRRAARQRSLAGTDCPRFPISVPHDHVVHVSSPRLYDDRISRANGLVPRDFRYLLQHVDSHSRQTILVRWNYRS